MSLIVETGAGFANAESYASVADADNYFSLRGISIWSNLSPAEKEQALRRGTDYMVQTYRSRWLGRRESITQVLDWPRVGVLIEAYGSATFNFMHVPLNSVPTEVKNACAELALRSSIATLTEDQSPRVTQETIGPVTVKYDPYSSQGVTYKQVDAMLRPFLQSSGGAMMRLTRT